MQPVRAFAVASLTPVALLVLAALFGGAWIWAALLYMTLFAFGIDQLVARVDPPADPLRDLPTADALSATLAVAHFGLLLLVIDALTTGALDIGKWLGLYVAAALFFGQVSNSNAHELIHRGDWRLFNLGKWVYISLLFGHHTSAPYQGAPPLRGFGGRSQHRAPRRKLLGLPAARLEGQLRQGLRDGARGYPPARQGRRDALCDLRVRRGGAARAVGWLFGIAGSLCTSPSPPMRRRSFCCRTTCSTTASPARATPIPASWSRSAPSTAGTAASGSPRI